MKTQIAIALFASYAAATEPTAATCAGYFGGLVEAGWDCSFKDLTLETCTKTGSTFADATADNNQDYQKECVKSDGTKLTWAQPTAASCKTWTDAQVADDAAFVVDDTVKKSEGWIMNCYKAGASTLAYGAAAIAAIAALSF